MSFRKRGDIIQSVPQTPQTGRVPPLASRSSAVSGRVPLQSSHSRGVPGVQVNRELPTGRKAKAVTENISVRPSLITSHPCTSTGCSDLDKVLMHRGLPLGNSLLVEESSTTDFASVIIRSFASQGVMHNRSIKDKRYAHVIVLGMTPEWSKELLGLYEGSSKDKKKAKIQENEKKISVSNLSTLNTPSSNQNSDLRIAWRYGLNKKHEEQETSSEQYKYYNHQFDLTRNLLPGPSNKDISYVQLSENYKKVIDQIHYIVKSQINADPTVIIRICVPNLLNTSLFPPTMTNNTYIIPLVHGLRSLLRQYSNNIVLMATLSLTLYPREGHLTGMFESLFDSVIHLQPFNPDMLKLIERAYKNEPTKIQQGLLNIIKLPVLSERGMMMIHDGEFAFKNSRKKFEIEEWGIPVEEEEGHSQEGQTTKNIDF